jgi:hypothetical protein
MSSYCFYLQIKQEDEEFCHKLGSIFVFNQDVEMGNWTVAEANQTLGIPRSGHLVVHAPEAYFPECS